MLEAELLACLPAARKRQDDLHQGLSPQDRQPQRGRVLPQADAVPLERHCCHLLCYFASNTQTQTASNTDPTAHVFPFPMICLLGLEKD